MGGLIQDLRYALRSLRRARGASAVAVAMLALGLGLNTSVFSLVNAINLRPLPYPDAEQLVDLYSSNREGSGALAGVSGPDVVDWRMRSPAFSDIALYQERTFNVELGANAEQMQGTRAGGNLLGLLGVSARLGRTLLPRDEQEGSAVVVLSHALWRDRFGADPAVLGRQLRIDGVAHDVVGVMPEYFTYPDFAQFWVPFSQAALLDRADRRYSGIGRLRADDQASVAVRDLNRVAEQLAVQHAASNNGWSVVGASVTDNRAEPFFLALVVAAFFVLLVACANIGNLLLARGAARRGELAIRLMIGASRGRILRQLVSESALLAAIGAGFGLLLAAWGTDLLVELLPADALPLWLDFSVDLRVLGYTAAVLVIAVLTFGVMPALSTMRSNLYSAAKERGRRVTGGRSATRLRNAMIVGQIALSLILLSSAAIIVRSVMATSRATPGYDPAPILQASVSLPTDRFPTTEARARYVAEARAALDRIPGAQLAAVSTALPPDRVVTGTPTAYGPVTGEGSSATLEVARYHAISSNFFETLELPLSRGRAFADIDGSVSAVVILSERAASSLWPGQDAIGKRVKLARGERSAQWLTVIGVAGNRYDIARGQGSAAARTPAAEVYLPAAQGVGERVFFLVRARSGQPMELAQATRLALLALTPDQPGTDISALTDEIYDNVRVLRWLGSLAGAFAAFALVLASIGMFGVIAYSVTQRTQEIGIRMALGATPGAVVRLLATTGTRLAALGIALGLLGALAAGQVLAGVVHGVSPRDPLALTTVALLLGGVAYLASWWPARRASRIDPVTALQTD